MKVSQLLAGVPVILTNEERSFIDAHNETVMLSGLKEHDLWVAQNLVRKGIYAISKDNITLLKQ